MLNFKRIVLFGILPVLFSACKKDNMLDLVKPTGGIETRIREVSGFRHIELDDKIEVYVSQGPAYEVKVEAGKNLHKNIITEVKDSILFIRNDNTCNFVRSQDKKIKIYLTAPHYKFFKNNGVGTIYCSTVIKEDTILTSCTSSGDIHLNLDVKEIRSSSHGNGDLYLSGKTEKSFHYMNGTNFIYGEDFTIGSYIFIETFSVGHCYIKAPENGLFEASLWSRGNIYYTGNPQNVVYKMYNTGDIIKK